MRQIGNIDGSIMAFDDKASPRDHEKYKWRYENGQDIHPSMPGAPVEQEFVRDALEAAGIKTRPGATPNQWFHDNFVMPYEYASPTGGYPAW